MLDNHGSEAVPIRVPYHDGRGFCGPVDLCQRDICLKKKLWTASLLGSLVWDLIEH